MGCAEDLPVKILVYSFLMCVGLAISQFIPQAEDDEFGFYVRLPAGIALSYIIVHVGLDFEIVKWRLPTYALDFFVATSAALVPLLVVFGYLKYVCGSHSLPHAWYVEEPLGTSQGLLLSVFSAPTSAGMLISMMEAADLKHTWVFKKASMLAILDDIDSLVFIAFMRILAIGGSQIDLRHFGPVIVTVGLLTIAWFNIHKFVIPHSWPWVLMYAFILGTGFWIIEGLTREFPHCNFIFVVAVLIPSFTLGCVTYDPKMETSQSYKHIEIELTEEFIERQEYIDSHAPCMETFMGCAFMFFVGLSMPSLNSLGSMSHSAVIFHVVAINILMLLGKLIICFFYSNETSKTQRIALGLAMCPRGEIGASVIIITIQTLKGKIDDAYLGVVVLSVIMNLVTSCGLIVYVKKLAARG